MANLYGVANAPFIDNPTGIGSSVACPAGAETNAVPSTAMIAPSNGYYYPVAWGYIPIILGATAPSAVVLALRIGNGADIAQQAIPGTLLVNNATIWVPSIYFGPPSQTPWMGAGSILNISVTPTGQAVTVGNGGLGVYFGLLRAPDQ